MQQIWLRPNMAGTMGNGARNVKGIPQTRGACSRFAVNGNPPVKDGAMATFFWRVWPRRYSGAAPTDVISGHQSGVPTAAASG
jgi:hypothetical protein